ncbi:hypothetical protein ACODNH_12795 [Haloarcula sp. NS06]|nr:hypothetical protein [Haloarcula sp. H-GB4]MDQ2071151.1 hypothetical protein [Haloarcula sp. H-GB4]
MGSGFIGGPQAEDMGLGDQHDAYRVVTEPPADANQYISKYFGRFDIVQ